MIGRKCFIVLAAIVAIGAAYGIAIGKTHHVATLTLCAITIITLINDIKTTTKKKNLWTKY